MIEPLEPFSAARLANEDRSSSTVGTLVDLTPPLMSPFTKDSFQASYGQQFTMLAAPPGAGSGVGVVIPNLLSYPDSMVVNDPFEFEMLVGHRHPGSQPMETPIIPSNVDERIKALALRHAQSREESRKGWSR